MTIVILVFGYFLVTDNFQGAGKDGTKCTWTSQKFGVT